MNTFPFHVTADSREVKPGSRFFAFQGAKFDGHLYAEKVAEAGALEIYVEHALPETFAQKFPHVSVQVLGTHARKRFAEMASEMCGYPSQKLKMVAVTGTSGKTTTTYLIQHLFNHSSQGKIRCARMGTNGAEFEGKEWNTENTTPDALSLQLWFKEILELGATHVVMEVSSHSLVQDRAWGIAWDACAFLNLSPEHLDYHPTLEDYFSAKSLLFTDHLDFSKKNGKSPLLLSNGDNAYGIQLGQKNSVIQTYSAQKETTDLKNTPTGIAGGLHRFGKMLPLQCPLFGTFQIENILAALHVVEGLTPGDPALNETAILKALSNFPGVPGRMEFISNSRGIFPFVDYAHKPEALEKVLKAIQGKRIITVFGCGGDRDKTKRPVMGRIAAELSDYVILTSDNPRTEDPNQILREVEAGITAAIREKTAKIEVSDFTILADRGVAIARAVHIARSGDVILVAGKGHENYQIFGSEKRHFDDREELRNLLHSI
jgi:UDP-N-acetylmuramoyl-L-alanyl-D-glutamate--2,6-diaminopimelate ligase